MSGCPIYDITFTVKCLDKWADDPEAGVNPNAMAYAMRQAVLDTAGVDPADYDITWKVERKR